MIGIALNQTGLLDDHTRPENHDQMSKSMNYVKNSKKASKRDLKKHGIQPFVSNKDLPMTQQRCVVSSTTPFFIGVVIYFI